MTKQVNNEAEGLSRFFSGSFRDPFGILLAVGFGFPRAIPVQFLAIAPVQLKPRSVAFSRQFPISVRAIIG